MERETHTVDATGVSLGRLAVAVAVFLRGKHKPAFNRREDLGDFVIVKNFKGVKFTGKKPKQKIYYHHTYYLGGLKKQTLEEALVKNPSSVLKRAVLRMLPNTKHRDVQIQRLKVEL